METDNGVRRRLAELRERDMHARLESEATAQPDGTGGSFWGGGLKFLILEGFREYISPHELSFECSLVFHISFLFFSE